MPLLSRHIQGTLLTALGVLILTPDGLLVRLISADTWTVLFWRGLLMAIGIFGFYFLRYGKGAVDRIINTGLRGLQASVLFTISTIFFIQSLHNTSVANTLVILATTPLLAALISRLFLKERVNLSTWVAILVGCGGIAYIFKGSLSSDHLMGDCFALGAAFAMASQITTIRHAQNVDMVPTLGLSGLLVAVVALVMAGNVSVSTPDMLYLMLLGLIVLPLAFGLISVGPRYIPAAEVSLMMLLETFLGPLWVWLVIGEEPTQETMIGGTLVLATLAAHTLYNARRKPAISPAA